MALATATAVGFWFVAVCLSLAPQLVHSCALGWSDCHWLRSDSCHRMLFQPVCRLGLRDWRGGGLQCFYASPSLSSGVQSRAHFTTTHSMGGIGIAAPVFATGAKSSHGNRQLLQKHSRIFSPSALAISEWPGPAGTTAKRNVICI